MINYEINHIKKGVILLLLMLSLLTACTKTEYITRTETVDVFIPQYRDFDVSTINCKAATLTNEMTWAGVVITLHEHLAKCLSSMKLVINTLNPE